jgi:hypothetical protein
MSQKRQNLKDITLLDKLIEDIIIDAYGEDEQL